MRPINVPQVGKPEMKLFVPSMGSRTQTYSASGRSAPYSSPITPCAGNVCEINLRIAASAPRSASVTGSNAPPRDLSSAPIELRKNGRITSLDTCASRSTKAAKSTAVISSPPYLSEKEEFCAAIFAYQPCRVVGHRRLASEESTCKPLFDMGTFRLWANRAAPSCGKNVALADI